MTRKEKNGTIRFAYECADTVAGARSPRITSSQGLTAFDIKEALSPAFLRVENERARLARTIGESDQGLQVPQREEKESDEAFSARVADFERKYARYVEKFGQLLEEEVEFSTDLPTVSLPREVFDELGISGYQSGSLRRLGGLEIVDPPAPKTRQQRRSSSRRKATR